MIISYIFLFLILFLLAGLLFYLYEFFIPSLKLKYTTINENFDTDHFTEFESAKKDLNIDFTKIAVVKNTEEAAKDSEHRLFYKGEKNCQLFHSVYVSEFKNTVACIGFGDCIKKCPQNAITLEKEKIKISQLCNGCGECISACPENLISLVPKTTENTNFRDEKVFKFWHTCYKLFKGSASKEEVHPEIEENYSFL